MFCCFNTFTSVFDLWMDLSEPVRTVERTASTIVVRTVRTANLHLPILKISLKLEFFGDSKQIFQKSK